MKMDSAAAVLERIGLKYEMLDSGCCGMAGAFGFESGNHFDVSKRVGERVLLPAVRAADRETLIVANGFSCREQIAQSTKRRGLHLAEVIQLALKQSRSQPVQSNQHTRSQAMRYQRFGDRFIVRLESGESVLEELTELLATEKIGFASVSAAGAVAWVRLAYWNAQSQTYEERDFDEQLEVVSFEGNSSLKDEKPFLHLHAVFARHDFSTLGGHLRDARVHPTMEIWLRAEDVPVSRIHDATTGLDLLDLPGQ